MTNLKQIFLQDLNSRYTGTVQRNVFIGKDLYGNDFYVDFVVDNRIFVKYLSVVPYKTLDRERVFEHELMHYLISYVQLLADIVSLERAYFVIHGRNLSKESESLIKKQKHREYLKQGELVQLISPIAFLNKLNSGGL